MFKLKHRALGGLLCIGLSFSAQAQTAVPSFHQQIDDFLWNAYNAAPANAADDARMAAAFTKMTAFVQEHRQDYMNTRRASLTQWNGQAVDLGGFVRLDNPDLQRITQELIGATEAYRLQGLITSVRLLTVQEKSQYIYTKSSPFMYDKNLNAEHQMMALNQGMQSFYGVRYATREIVNNVWQVSVYGRKFAYQYVWDLNQDKIGDLTFWRVK